MPKRMAKGGVPVYCVVDQDCVTSKMKGSDFLGEGGNWGDYLERPRLVERRRQRGEPAIIQRRNQKGNGVHDTEHEAHVCHPSMNDVELLMPDAGQQRDHVRFAGQCYDDRRARDGHQSGTNGERRRAVAAALAVVRLHGEREHRQEDGRGKEQEHHAGGRQAEAVCNPAAEAPVGNCSRRGTGAGEEGDARFAIVGSSIAATGLAVAKGADGVQEEEQEDDADVVIRRPVAVLELPCPGDGGLGGIVGRVEGEAGIVGAERVAQGEIREGRVRAGDISVHGHGRQ